MVTRTMRCVFWKEKHVGQRPRWGSDGGWLGCAGIAGRCLIVVVDGYGMEGPCWVVGGLYDR